MVDSKYRGMRMSSEVEGLHHGANFDKEKMKATQ